MYTIFTLGDLDQAPDAISRSILPQEIIAKIYFMARCWPKKCTRNCNNGLTFPVNHGLIQGWVCPKAWTTRDITIWDITADCILLRDAACKSFRAPEPSGRSTSNIFCAFGMGLLDASGTSGWFTLALGVWDLALDLSWERPRCGVLRADRCISSSSIFVSSRSLRCLASS